MISPVLSASPGMNMKISQGMIACCKSHDVVGHGMSQTKSVVVTLIMMTRLSVIWFCSSVLFFIITFQYCNLDWSDVYMIIYVSVARFAILL